MTAMISASGMVQENYHLYLTTVTGLLQDTEQIENTVVDVVKGTPVLVRNLAQVVPGRYVVELSTPPLGMLARAGNRSAPTATRRARIDSEQHAAQPRPVHLPAVGVAAQHQVEAVFAEVFHRLRIVGQHDARCLRAAAGQSGVPTVSRRASVAPNRRAAQAKRR